MLVVVKDESAEKLEWKQPIRKKCDIKPPLRDVWETSMIQVTQKNKDLLSHALLLWKISVQNFLHEAIGRDNQCSLHSSAAEPEHKDLQRIFRLYYMVSNCCDSRGEPSWAPKQQIPIKHAAHLSWRASAEDLGVERHTYTSVLLNTTCSVQRFFCTANADFAGI